MKIAIFTDIHGNYEALSSIIEDIKKSKIDSIICLGDTIGIGPNSKECLDLIIENNITMILGNHELYYLNKKLIEKYSKEEQAHHRWIASTLTKKHTEFLKKCPIYLSKEYNSYNMFFSHFIIKHNSDYPFYHTEIINSSNITTILKDLPYNYFFHGHLHLPVNKNINNKKVICLSSSGCTKNNITKYTIIDLDKLNITEKELPYNRENFINSIEKLDYPCKKELLEIFF